VDEQETRVLSTSRETHVYGQMPHALLAVPGLAAELFARVRSLARYATTWTRTWSRTSSRLVALRRRMRRLTKERRRLQLELGGAVYAQDDGAAAGLIRGMRDVDAALAAAAVAADRAVEQANETLERERLAIQRTEIHRAVR
jgi:hypothetical protein